ncbi:MMPL family transporter [Brachybacterium sp. GPGPB12]|uniref:magnesium transporter MgtE N-terminal domain-containing protein n=1 Tax=Brachybacterium sp. GPGPB12 TaxID=3023517 RepID=UPI0031343F8A
MLSFGTALGVSAIVFNQILDFPGADAAVPLYGFVFLVALGIDYNIFLMTRVREEAKAHGTRDGITRGLAITGGVITSAGVVLAATFSALAVIPILFLVRLAFIVAFGGRSTPSSCALSWSRRWPTTSAGGSGGRLASRVRTHRRIAHRARGGAGPALGHLGHNGSVTSTAALDTVLDLLRTDPQSEAELEHLAREARLLPTGELVYLVGARPATEAALLFRVLDKARALAVFEGLSSDHQAELISALRTPQVAEIIGDLDPDDRASLFDESPASVAERLMHGLDADERAMTTAVLGYPRHAIGRYMSPEVLAPRPDQTVAEALAEVRERGEDAETVYLLPVVDSSRVVAGGGGPAPSVADRSGGARGRPRPRSSARPGDRRPGGGRPAVLRREAAGHADRRRGGAARRRAHRR